MCAPILMTGLQVAGSLSAAAQARAEAKSQAAHTRRQALIEAQARAADAARIRDRAEQTSAAERTRSLTRGLDPKSESLVASLASHHAERVLPALAQDHAARLALDEGDVTARRLRRGGQAAFRQSLLAGALTLANAAFGAGAFVLPK